MVATADDDSVTSPLMVAHTLVGVPSLWMNCPAVPGVMLVTLTAPLLPPPPPPPTPPPKPPYTSAHATAARARSITAAMVVWRITSCTPSRTQRQRQRF